MRVAFGHTSLFTRKGSDKLGVMRSGWYVVSIIVYVKNVLMVAVSFGNFCTISIPL